VIGGGFSDVVEVGHIMTFTCNSYHCALDFWTRLKVQSDGENGSAFVLRSQ
jgi:hypothetical protein